MGLFESRGGLGEASGNFLGSALSRSKMGKVLGQIISPKDYLVQNQVSQNPELAAGNTVSAEGSFGHGLMSGMFPQARPPVAPASAPAAPVPVMTSELNRRPTGSSVGSPTGGAANSAAKSGILGLLSSL